MDPHRRKFEIGLYHGDDSGHVLMHVNGEPMIIDFGIKEEKEYSFYVGSALFNLFFRKDRTQFSYELIQDEETPTLLNLARKRNERQDYMLMGIGVGVVGMLLLVFILL